MDFSFEGDNHPLCKFIYVFIYSREVTYMNFYPHSFYEEALARIGDDSIVIILI